MRSVIKKFCAIFRWGCFHVVLKFKAQLHPILGFNETSIPKTVSWHIQACEAV